MSGQSRSASPRSGIPPGRHSPWFAILVVLLAIVGTACSEGWDEGPMTPPLSEWAQDLNQCDESGPTSECPPIGLPGIETMCTADPSDPMCTEEDENGCIPIEDPNWCNGGGSGGGDGDGDQGGPGGGGTDPPDPNDPEEPEEADPELEVQCTPEVVERGGPTVSCTAMVSSGTIENLSWSFSGGVHTLSDLGSDNPLVGTMAVTGTVTATATVDSTSLSGSASITVTARNWFSGGYSPILPPLSHFPPSLVLTLLRRIRVFPTLEPEPPPV